MLVPTVGESCGAGAVDVAPSPQSGDSFADALEVDPGGGTPIAGSLDNALSYFRSTPVNPNGRYVLLAADGLPPFCQMNELARTLDALTTLRAEGILTYVLGYRVDGDPANLDDFAQAGGTGSHYAANSASQLLRALEGITSEVTVVTCQYTLESGPDDPAALHVSFDGQEVPRDPDHIDGWDYDPAARSLTFYGPACDDLRNSPEASIGADYCSDID